MTAQIDHSTSATNPSAPVRELYDRQQMLQLIEDAMRSEPHCVCGAPMTIEADDDTLWLACPTFTAASTGRLSWLRSGIRLALHQRQLIAREFGIAA